MVVVVRYFGGSLLGVPGLIHAYKTAAAEALDLCGIIEKSIEYPIKIQFDYTMMNEVQLVIKQHHCRISDHDMGLYCIYEIMIPLNIRQGLQAFNELRGWRCFKSFTFLWYLARLLPEVRRHHVEMIGHVFAQYGFAVALVDVSVPN
jgi:hypothetical protein